MYNPRQLYWNGSQIIDADMEATRSVLRSRPKLHMHNEISAFGDVLLPSWLHIEMKDSYGNISDEDVAEMNSHTLDFTRKGYIHCLLC